MQQVASAYVEPYGTRIEAAGCTMVRRGICWWEMRLHENVPVTVFAQWDRGESVVTGEDSVFQIYAHSEDRSAPEGILRVRVWKR